MQLIVLKAVLLAMPERSAPAFFYAQYGIVHSVITGDYETAFEFGELGVRLAGKPRTALTRARPTSFALFLSHLRRHLGQPRRPADRLAVEPRRR